MEALQRSRRRPQGPISSGVLSERILLYFLKKRILLSRSSALHLHVTPDAEEHTSLSFSIVGQSGSTPWSRLSMWMLASAFILHICSATVPKPLGISRLTAITSLIGLVAKPIDFPTSNQTLKNCNLI
jgi:hypothetical protein